MELFINKSIYYEENNKYQGQINQQIITFNPEFSFFFPYFKHKKSGVRQHNSQMLFIWLRLYATTLLPPKCPKCPKCPILANPGEQAEM